MSNSCALMRIILCRHFLFFISVFSELSEHAVSEPFFDNGPKFSGDFMKFVKDMGRIVYNRKDEKSTRELLSHPIMRQLRISTRSPKIKDSRRDVNNLMAQESALRDVLMMKLVSYYEDKYKLSNTKTTTWTTNNFVLAGGARRRHESVSDCEETTPIAEKTEVPEVVVI